MKVYLSLICSRLRLSASEKANNLLQNSMRANPTYKGFKLFFNQTIESLKQFNLFLLGYVLCYSAFYRI